MLEKILEISLIRWAEIFGTIAGLIYILLAIKQNWVSWILAIISSTLFIFVFFVSKFYADMGLQVYYVLIGFYGLYFWLKGGKTNSEEKSELPVSRTPRKLIIYLIVATVVIFVVIAFILKKFTDSAVPYWDSLTTAGSIVATWMLARKYLEQWIMWIVIDVISIALYIYKGLYPTIILFVAYTIMATVAYFTWKKDMEKQSNELKV